uniref:Uncharacterized protein n=1 Tax=Stomoxys calcitrans TaxID=35570 RepID=A0A1I8PWD3_STOCA
MLVLVTALLAVAFAAPEPEPEPAPAKASRFRAAQIINDDATDEDIGDNDGVDEKDADVSDKKGDASSGRLFMKKFLLFRNMFGNTQQPVIPIIITGGTNTGTATVTNPTANTPTTTTVTTTGTIPTATGTITTTPLTAAARVEKKKPAQRIQLAARGSYENDNEEEDEQEQEEMEEETPVVDNEALAAALAANAEEYVVTDQEIGGTSDGTGNNAAAKINLRRNGSQRGKVVSVRVPAKYRGYFKNGQRVMLNNNGGVKRVGGKKRVIKKRIIKRGKKNKNRNKRRRVRGKH